MATKLKVTYSDNRKVSILATPRAQVEAERRFRTTGGITEATRVEAGYFLAWASLHYTGQESAEFEAWLGTIAEVEEAPKDEADEQAVEPTPAVPTPTGLSS
jgi:hypothetical protein